jgi:hypothetical protein
MTTPTQFLKERKRADERAARDRLPVRMRDDLIQKEFRRLLRLDVFRDLRRFAHLDKIRRSHTKGYSTGRAWRYQGRVIITLGIGADWPDICTLLCHELAHVKSSQRGHGDRWRATFVEAVAEAYNAPTLARVGGSVWDLHNAVIDIVRASQ